MFVQISKIPPNVREGFDVQDLSTRAFTVSEELLVNIVVRLLDVYHKKLTK